MTTVYSNEAFVFFLFSVILGLVSGVFYDAFRALRTVARKVWVAFICDIVFFISFGIFVYLFCLCTVDGRIRLFIVVGVILGFTGYRCSVSAFITAVFVWLIRLLLKTVGFLLLPIKKLGIISYKGIKKIFFSKIYEKVIKKLLKKGKRILYNEKTRSKRKGMRKNGGEEKNGYQEAERYFS